MLRSTLRSTSTFFVYSLFAAALWPLDALPDADEARPTDAVAIAHTDADGRLWFQSQRRPLSATRVAAKLSTADLSRQAAYVVTDPGDAPDDSIEDGVYFPQTLRAAVENISYFGGVNTVTFDPGITQVNITSAMPFITALTTIDGGDPRVILDGSAIAPTGFAEYALGVSGAGAVGSVIENLEIQNFPDGGMFVGTQDVEVYNCVIHDNTGPGILGNFARNCQIGDTLPGLRNFIYDNTGTAGDGIQFIQFSHDNHVVGNYLGTVDGFTAAGNSRRGIKLEGNGNRIEANVISGNNYDGIFMGNDEFQPATDNQVVGNVIGLTADGSAILGNGSGNNGSGISIRYGLRDTLSHNLIGGNTNYGIVFESAADAMHVYGNVIGLDSAETAGMGNGLYGALLRGDGNFIEENTIAANFSSGMAIQGDGNRIEANLLGYDVPGPPFLGNGLFGVTITGDSNVVGGATPAEGNVISYNNGSGVLITGNGSTGNVVQNNLIGTDLFGLEAVPNGSGVTVRDSSHGTQVLDNFIGANFSDGIYVGIFSNRRPRGTIIEGNTIGWVATDTLRSSRDGIRINGAVGTLIGAVVPTPGFNSIKYSGGAGIYLVKADSTIVSGDTICLNAAEGVRIDTGLYNYVSFNSIFANGGLGIDLGGDGVTANDLNDADGGPNVTQNYPVINIVSVVGDTMHVVGTLDAEPDATYEIDIYSSPACDPSGFGEGATWIAQYVATTAGNGIAALDFDVTYPFDPNSEVLTFTATDSLDNTSEFSACYQQGLVAADMQIAKSASTDTVSLADTLVYTLAIINNGPDPATGTQATDSLPGGVSYVSHSIDAGSANFVAGVLTCDPGTMQPGDTVTATITVVADSLGQVVNTAFADAAEADAVPQNDVSSATVEVVAAVAVSGDDGLRPRVFALLPNYPNPFNPSTSLAFQAPHAAHVEVDVLNVLGRRVRRLADRVYEAGTHRLVWDGLNDQGSATASGIYICRLSTPAGVFTRKILLLR